MPDENKLSQMVDLLKVIAANTEHAAVNGEIDRHPHVEFCSICHPTSWTHNRDHAIEVCPVCAKVDY